MDIKKAVRKFVNSPHPLWETELTKLLVRAKWQELKEVGILNEQNYTTSRSLKSNYRLAQNSELIIEQAGQRIFLEASSIDLIDFYKAHGLSVYNIAELEKYQVFSKLKKALMLFQGLGHSDSCIIALVRSIQGLKQDDKEIDISYSHPNIPFSIFVSVCEDQSTISNLRVAESILHESMHLKLTLIENTIPLVKPGANNLFFSPWREEQRPAGGILHGLFVFKAIFNFYSDIKNKFKTDETLKYIKNREDQIAFEIQELKNFNDCSDLTEYGAILTKNLLPLN